MGTTVYLCVYMYIRCGSDALDGQKRVWNPLELSLQMIGVWCWDSNSDPLQAQELLPTDRRLPRKCIFIWGTLTLIRSVNTVLPPLIPLFIWNEAEWVQSVRAGETTLGISLPQCKRRRISQKLRMIAHYLQSVKRIDFEGLVFTPQHIMKLRGRSL